jgi:Mn-dependent DtxR family transcriptional regulator
MGILKSEDLISVDENGYITLTVKGLEIANKMYERHRLLTEFLVSIGVDEKIATEDACRIEHCISEQSFNAIKEIVSKSGK